MAAAAAVAIFFSAACDLNAARFPGRNQRDGVTVQGVQVSAAPNSRYKVRDVQRVLRAILEDGMCSKDDIKNTRIMLISTPYLMPAGDGHVIVGITYPDGSVIIAALSDFFTSEHPYKIIIHEYAHVCHGDGAHENAALWQRVDEIFARFKAAEEAAGRPL